MEMGEIHLALLNMVTLELEATNLDQIHAQQIEVMASEYPQRTEMMVILRVMMAAQIFEWLKMDLHVQAVMKVILTYALNNVVMALS